jgi:hypothetical protein
MDSATAAVCSGRSKVRYAIDQRPIDSPRYTDANIVRFDDTPCGIGAKELGSWRRHPQGRVAEHRARASDTSTGILNAAATKCLRHPSHGRGVVGAEVWRGRCHEPVLMQRAILQSVVC